MLRPPKCVSTDVQTRPSGSYLFIDLLASVYRDRLAASAICAVLLFKSILLCFESLELWLHVSATNNN